MVGRGPGPRETTSDLPDRVYGRGGSRRSGVAAGAGRGAGTTTRGVGGARKTGAARMGGAARAAGALSTGAAMRGAGVCSTRGAR